MKTKILFGLILGVFLINFISAASTEDLIGVKQNSCANISQTCATCSYVNISSISSKDNSDLITSVSMTDIGNGEWRYTFCNTSSLGRYDVKGIGDINGVDSSFRTSFYVTKLGEVATGNLEMLIWILFIIAAAGNVIFFILILVKLATTNETIFGVLISWAFYGLMIIVSYLSGLLITPYISNISDFFLDIFVWSNCVLPVIALVITMFKKGTDKKKPISIQELTGRVQFNR